MDRQSIIVIVACLLLIMLWNFGVAPKLSKPLPPRGTNAPPATLMATNEAATSPAAPAVVEQPVVPSKPLVTAHVPEELLIATNSNARYTFSSYGGGLKLVELVHYPETVSASRSKQPPPNNLATLNASTPAPTLALLGGDAVQGDGIFTLSQTDRFVRAEKTLTNGLAIVKEFRLSTNYLVPVTVRLENRSEQPLALPAQEWVVGTATPMGPDDKGMAVGRAVVQWHEDRRGGRELLLVARVCRARRAFRRRNIARARATWFGWPPTTSSSRWRRCRSSRRRRW